MRKMLVCLSLILMVGSFGCSEKRNPEAEAAALEAAKSWLALVDGDKYEESWEDAGGLLKGAVTKDRWLQSMQTIRKPFGKNLDRTIRSIGYYTSLPGVPDGQYVSIKFKSTFENQGLAIETITPMLEKDGKWRISAYYMNY
jgi:hypothetical protein